jgi:hypothetical protein
MPAVGYQHLCQVMGLLTRGPSRPALIKPVSRIDRNDGFLAVPEAVAPSEADVLGHVLFALKHEGTDLQILSEALPKLPASWLVDELRRKPNGQYIRLACYLWEAFSGEALQDLPAIGGQTVPVFDPERYVTLPGERSARWRVQFNGLGSLRYCMTVERTASITTAIASDILGRVAALSRDADPAILDRALGWAYLSETQASFEIERETASHNKARTFVRLLQHAHERRPLSEEYLVELQAATVDNPFDRAASFRTEQNYLSSAGPGALGVTYIPPPPSQVPELMGELMGFAKASAGKIDPIVAAGCVSFGFVFIHPFMDGNGRLSRFLFHHALCCSGRLENGLILPVSVAMSQAEREYLETLTAFSKPARELWRVRTLDRDQFEFAYAGPDNYTPYRYWDATQCVEFGFKMAESALDVQLQQQVAYIHRYDAVVRQIDREFDIRNSILSTLVRSCLENGKLSKRRRDQFQDSVPPGAFDAIEKAVSVSAPESGADTEPEDAPAQQDVAPGGARVPGARR